MTDLAEKLEPTTSTSSIPLATDRELLTLWVERLDAKSLEGIIRRHGRLVHSLTHKLLTSPHDRADAFQTVFLLLTQQARKIRQRESLSMWIYGVTVRTCLMMSRQRAHTPVPDHVEAPPFPDREVLEHQELILTLNKELQQLPEHLRETLVLVYLEGHSRQAAAELTNTTEQTIKSRLARGRNLLRARLLKQGVTFTTAFTTFSLMAPTSNAAETTLPEQLIDQTLTTCQTGELGGAPFTLPLDPITILPTGAPVMSSTTFYGTLAVTTLLLLTTMGLGNRGQAEGRVENVNIEVPDVDVMGQVATPIQVGSAVRAIDTPQADKAMSVEAGESRKASSPDAITNVVFDRQISLPLGVPTEESKADVYIFPLNPATENPQLILVMENTHAIPLINASQQGLYVRHTLAEHASVNAAIGNNDNPFVVVPHGLVDVKTLSRMMFRMPESVPQDSSAFQSVDSETGPMALTSAREASLQAYKDQLDGYLSLINQTSSMNARMQTPGYSAEDLYDDWKHSNERVRNLLEKSLVRMESDHSDPALAEKIKEFRKSHYQLARENLRQKRSHVLQRVLNSSKIEDDVIKQLDVINDCLAEINRSEAGIVSIQKTPSSSAAVPSGDTNAEAIQSAYHRQVLEYIQNRFALLQLQTSKERPDEINSIEQAVIRSLERQEENFVQFEHQLTAISDAAGAKARRTREGAYDALVAMIEKSIKQRTEEAKYSDPRNQQIVEHFHKTIERINEEKKIGSFAALSQSERSYLEPVTFQRVPEDVLTQLEQQLPELKARLHALRRDFGPDVQEAKRLANYINFLESQKKIEKTYVKSPDGKTVVLVEPELEQQNSPGQREAENSVGGSDFKKERLHTYSDLMFEYTQDRFALMQLQISKEQPAIMHEMEKALWRSLDGLEKRMISIEDELAAVPDGMIEAKELRLTYYMGLIENLNDVIQGIDQQQKLQSLPELSPHDQQIRDHVLQTLKYVKEEEALGSFKAVSKKVRTDLSSILFKKLPPPTNLDPKEEMAILTQKLAELRDVLGWDHPAVKRFEKDLQEKKNVVVLSETKKEETPNSLDKTKINIVQSLEQEKAEKKNDTPTLSGDIHELGTSPKESPAQSKVDENQQQKFVRVVFNSDFPCHVECTDYAIRSPDGLHPKLRIDANSGTSGCQFPIGRHSLVLIYKSQSGLNQFEVPLVLELLPAAFEEQLGLLEITFDFRLQDIERFRANSYCNVVVATASDKKHIAEDGSLKPKANAFVFKTSSDPRGFPEDYLIESGNGGSGRISAVLTTSHFQPVAQKPIIVTDNSGTSKEWMLPLGRPIEGGKFEIYSFTFADGVNNVIELRKETSGCVLKSSAADDDLIYRENNSHGTLIFRLQDNNLPDGRIGVIVPEVGHDESAVEEAIKRQLDSLKK